MCRPGCGRSSRRFKAFAENAISLQLTRCGERLGTFIPLSKPYMGMTAFGRLRQLSVLLFVTMPMAPAGAQAPSFDCERATVPAEKAVCSTPALASAGRSLAEAYQAALNAAGVDPEVLKQQQLAWVRDRNQRCKPAHPGSDVDPAFLTCLSASYATRTQQLVTPPTADAACLSFVGALKAAGDAGFTTGLAAIAAGAPGTGLRLDRAVEDGYTLQSTYAGSLNCQSPHLFRTVFGHRVEISVPPAFGPDEGRHCATDSARLASINGIPGLLDEDSSQNGSGSSTVKILLRVGDRWTPACTVAVATRTRRRVAFAGCAGGSCGPLATLAARYSADRHEAGPDPALPTGDSLHGKQSTAYAALLVAADAANIGVVPDLPFVTTEVGARTDQQMSSGCDLGFDGVGGALFPVVVDGKVLLGKIGADGFGLGGHAGGPNDALAIYRLSGTALEPVAGFCIRVGRTAMTSIRVSP